MEDNNTQATRRSVLKISLGSVAAATIPKTALADSGDGMDPVWSEATADLGDQAEVIVSVEGALKDITDETPSDHTDAQQAIESVQESTLNTLQNMDGVTVHRSFWLGNAIFATVADNRLSDVASLDSVTGLYENREIAPPDPIDPAPREAHTTQDTPVESTYGVEQINALAARDEFSATGDGVTIGVVDTGIDPTHQAFPDFNPDNFAEFTLMAEQVDTDPNDPDSHGTHVSGTALGNRALDPVNEVEREIGVAPDAELLSAKVFSTFDGATSATTAQVVAGIQWSVENGADIINMSLGSSVDDESVFDPFYLEVLRDVVDLGVLPVSAAGNNGQGLTGSPGNIRESFSAAANDNARSLADFSSGEQVYSENAWDPNVLPDDYPSFYTIPDVSAPGVDVLSSIPGGGYAEFNGTSMASPHTAGAAAQLLSADIDTDLSITEVQTQLEQTAVHPSGPSADDTEFGVGTIDVLAAITDAAGGGTVTGTLQFDGQPLPETQVFTEYGTTGFTGADGSYELTLPPGENTIIFDEFGAVTETVTVDVPSNDTTTVDVDLDPELVVQPLGLLISQQLPPAGSTQPPELAAGDDFTLLVRVANLETLTVELGPDTEGVEPSDVTLSVGDTDFDIGQPLPVGGLTGAVPLTVTVDPSGGSPVSAYANDNNIVSVGGVSDAISDWQAGDIGLSLVSDVLAAWQSGDSVESDTDFSGGTLDLEHTFQGAGEQVSVVTGPTTVIDGQPATFEITDATLPTETGGELDADNNPGTITVTATIENTGDAQATKSVIYSTLGFQFPQAVTIPAGDTVQYETGLVNLVAAGFAGTETQHAIITPDDQVAGPLLISEPETGASGEFVVLDIEAPATVTAGETIEVVARIGNTRPGPFSSLVQYVFDERASGDDTAELVEFRAIEIDGESFTEATFSVDTDGLLPGEYFHTIATANDSAAAPIVVEADSDTSALADSGTPADD